MSSPVVIVAYEPGWPDRFEEEKRRLLATAGERIVLVEHVGSTSVPGLAAKPIVDIMAGVRRLADAEACIPRLEALGYRYRPEHESVLPERRYLDREGSGREAPVPLGRLAYPIHLHMVEVGSDFWVRHLLFRDYLRAHGEIARAYAELKYALAEGFGSDRAGYTDAKSDFIRAVEARARREGRRPVRQVAVGSRNPVKIAAVESAVRRVWPRVEVVACDADSGVSEQPISDEESIAGATNRAWYVLRETGADVGIGVEGGVSDRPCGMFVSGWSAVVDRYGTAGIGSGGHFLLPESIARSIRAGGELGPEMDRLTGQDGVKRNQGAVGIFTGGLISRTEALEKSVIFALARFIVPGYYEDGEYGCDRSP